MNAEASVQQLEIATGLKRYGFTTIRSIINSSVEDIAMSLRIETHVAKIIVDEARRIYMESSIKQS